MSISTLKKSFYTKQDKKAYFTQLGLHMTQFEKKTNNIQQPDKERVRIIQIAKANLVD